MPFFFIYLFSVKIRLEKRFHNVLDRKQTIFGHKKFNISKSQKSYFSKGVNPCFWSKNAIFFIYLFSVKIRLEKRFHNVLDRKQTIFGHKKINISKSQKSHFSKGVNPCFWSKNAIFFIYLCSVKIRLEMVFNNVLDRKETFFGHKKFNISKSQKSHFSKGVNPCFWSKNAIFFYLFVFGQNKTRKKIS